jgi:RNA 3'-terminal phosphate cyclase (ATP)
VAERTAQEAKRWLASGATVGEYLADQLLLPMALAGGGRFTVNEISSHMQTNIGVIEKFLPVEFDVTACGGSVHSVSIGNV